MKIVLEGVVVMTLLMCAIGSSLAPAKALLSSEVSWGAETNGIRVGMIIGRSANGDNAPIRCTPVISSSIKAPNKLSKVFVYFPPAESCFEVNMKDSKGNSVLKTREGTLLGKPVTEPLMVKVGGVNVRAGYRMHPLIQNQPEVLADFSFALQDYFIFPRHGKYSLMYQMRLIIPQSVEGNYMSLYTTNFPVTILPPVVVDFEVDRSDIKPKPVPAEAKLEK